MLLPGFISHTESSSCKGEVKRVRLCGLFSPVDLLSSHPLSLFLSCCLLSYRLSPRPPCSVVFSSPSSPIISLSLHLSITVDALKTSHKPFQRLLIIPPLTHSSCPRRSASRGSFCLLYLVSFSASHRGDSFRSW